MRMIMRLIERLESVGGAMQLMAVADELCDAGTKLMQSGDFNTYVGSQYCWAALMMMKRLSEKEPESGARSAFFTIYGKMHDCYTVNEMQTELEQIRIEAEHYVQPDDIELDVPEAVRGYIGELVNSKQ